MTGRKKLSNAAKTDEHDIKKAESVEENLKLYLEKRFADVEELLKLQLIATVSSEIERTNKVAEVNANDEKSANEKRKDCNLSGAEAVLKKYKLLSAGNKALLRKQFFFVKADSKYSAAELSKIYTEMKKVLKDSLIEAEPVFLFDTLSSGGKAYLSRKKILYAETGRPLSVLLGRLK